ncbi:hypothetical protein ACN4EK_10590 [Pantanalinema rosaneae CENA516]
MIPDNIEQCHLLKAIAALNPECIPKLKQVTQFVPSVDLSWQKRCG